MNSSYLFPLFFVAVAILSCTSHLIAQQSEPRTNSSILQTLDQNGDGILSADEIERATANLKLLDRNGDGQLEQHEMFATNTEAGEALSQDELEIDQQIENMVKRFFDGDADGDDLLSAAEIPVQVRKHLLSGDTNEDGFVNRNELWVLLEARIFRKPPKPPVNKQANVEAEQTPKQSAEEKPRQMSGGPLTIRLLDGLDSFLISGDREDVEAIQRAFRKAFPNAKLEAQAHPNQK